jgi:acetyl-CoA C-acetyltransferase
MATTDGLGGQKGVEGISGHLFTDDATAHAHHVGMVMGPGQPSGGGVVHDGRPDAFDLVGGDGDPDTGAAGAHPELGPPFDHGPTHRSPVFRVIDRRLGVRAQVVHVVAEPGEVLGKELLQAVPGVVGTDRDAHGRSILTALRPSGARGGGPDTLRLMALDPRTPVLVGVGQVTEYPDDSRPVTDRAEPVDLMASALRAAAEDCGGGGSGNKLLARAGSLRVMVPLSWRYINPGLLVAQRLGVTPDELALTAIGGNSPQTVVSLTALAIASGDIDVALLAGAECIFTRIAARRDPGRPILPWASEPPDTPEPVRLGVDRTPVTEVELACGLDRPIHVYPLFENALRAAAGEGIIDHQTRVSEMWARFSDVAAGNPHAWSPRARTALELRTVGPDNRMVSFPYPKLFNANDRVDQGAALILCSVDAARAAGVPEDRWVFPLSGTDAHDHWFLSHRRDLHSSPALRLCGNGALRLAGVGIDDVAHIDLYSCFPCAVQIAANELGLPIDDPGRPLTVTGGLGFAGGPGNNYVSHSIATMAGILRGDPGSLGLVTGLGWYVTKHAAGVWSTTPPSHGFAYDSPQKDVDALPQRAPASDFVGDATVETYTVVHGDDGEPERAIVSLFTDTGARSWGTLTDSGTLASLEVEEGCGRPARVRADGGIELR